MTVSGACMPVLVAAVAILATPSARAAGPEPQDAPFILGVNGHSFTQEGYWQVPVEQQMALVKEMGVGWYRYDWGWGLDFTHSDKLVAAAEAAGIKLLPVLFPPVAAAKGDLVEVRRLAFEYGKAVAARYKGRITHYELSNELDCGAMTKWPNGGDRDGAARSDYDFHKYAQYCELLRGLSEGVHDGDPAARRVIDAAGWLHFGFMDRLVDDAVPFEIVAWHWYSEMGDITEPKQSYSGKWDVIQKLKSWGKEVWITECNRRDGDMDGNEQAQADYLADQIRKTRATGVVKAFFAYELLDEPYFQGGEAHYGLVKLEKKDGKWVVGARKKAFEAMKRAAGG
jgi:hypothetical protein